VKLHREALGRWQRLLLPRLAPLAREHGFYLAGGTGLALQVGHRRSVDFDWFREDPIDDPLRLAADLRAPDFRFETDRVEKGTLHGRASGVRVSFLQYASSSRSIARGASAPSTRRCAATLQPSVSLPTVVTWPS
jgi:hypothetical protein